MPLSSEEVEHVAHLAHVGLTPAEIDIFAVELSSVVDHVARLQEVDTSNVEPTAHVAQLGTVMRQDIVRPSWPPADVVANAPRHMDNYFEVQAVLD